MQEALRQVVRDLGLRPDEDERDAAALEATLSQLRERGAVAASSASFLQLMHAQDFLRGEVGRYWVAISLREAESLRGEGLG